MTPDLSVIMPVYNHGRFIGRAISSVLDQGGAGTEVVVVDDGSTDDSAAVARAFPSRVRVLQQENRGLSAARNAGLAEARGRYVAFLDADDYWLPGFRAAMIAAMRREPADNHIAVCGWQAVAIDEAPLGRARPIRPDELVWTEFVLRNPIPVHTAVVHRSMVLKLGGFDAKSDVEDWDLWTRMLDAGCRFTTVERTLVAYRILPQSISSNTSRILSSSLALLDTVFARYTLPEAALRLRPQAYAWRYIDACYSCFGRGEDEPAEQMLRQAVAVWPPALSHPHTLYNLVHARQGRGTSPSARAIDVSEAEARTTRLLGLFERDDAAGVARARAEMFHVLAGLAVRQGDARRGRAYALRALRMDPRRYGRAAAVWVKGLVGERRWRAQAGTDRRT